jgi:hypothetical protein
LEGPSDLEMAATAGLARASRGRGVYILRVIGLPLVLALVGTCGGSEVGGAASLDQVGGRAANSRGPGGPAGSSPYRGSAIGNAPALVPGHLTRW